MKDSWQWDIPKCNQSASIHILHLYEIFYETFKIIINWKVAIFFFRRRYDQCTIPVSRCIIVDTLIVLDFYCTSRIPLIYFKTINITNRNVLIFLMLKKKQLIIQPIIVFSQLYLTIIVWGTINKWEILDCNEIRVHC